MDWIRRKKRAPSPTKSLTPDETITDTPTDVADSSDSGIPSESEKSPTEETSTEGLGRTTSAISTDADIVYPTGLPLAIVVVALCFSIFLVALDQTIIATAIPRITNQFHSLEDVGWYASAYLLTCTALQPTYGKMYQNFSLKAIFLAAVSIFELGSLICGVAPNSTVFIVGRAIAGLGAGGIFSGCLTILSYTVPLRKRPMFFGMIGAMFGVASVAGPLLGGVFTDHATWRWCFYINLPIGAITLIGIAIFFHNPDRAENHGTIRQRLKQLDFLGASFLIPGVVCLLLALQWGGTTYAWNSATIIGLFCGFGAIIVIFIIIQVRSGDQATIPVSIFFRRTVFFSAMFSFFVGSSFLIVVFYLPLYFQGVNGTSATHSGIDTLPLLLSVVLASIVGGILVTVLGYYTPFMICGMALFTIGCGLLSTLSPETPFGNWFGYQVLSGVGLGICLQLPVIAVQAVSRQRDVPVATAIVMFFQQLGGALFIAVGQAVFQNKLIPQMQAIDPSLSPIQITMAGATGLKALVSPDKLPLVLAAYANSLDGTFEVAIAMAGMATVMACFVEWKSVKGKKMGPAAAA